MDDVQKAQLWDILDPEGMGNVHKESIFDLLEMVLDPEAGELKSDETDLVGGLRALSQHVFRDSETVNADAQAVYSALERLNLFGKDEILVQLKRIERGGKIGRTRLDDLIQSMEEVTCAYIRTLYSRKQRKRIPLYRHQV